MSDPKDQLRCSVVGVGTAGRARAEAIRAHPRCTLVAVHHGRHAASLGVPVVASLAEAIELAEVVAIASPTPMHADHVRAVLGHGRHAIVEFPVATTAAIAESLFALARSVGKVLHVEHIELLDPPATTFAAHIRPAQVEAATVSFQGAGPATATATELAIGNVARLHRLVACTGPISAIRSVEHEPGRLVASFVLANGTIASATFERAPYFTRKTVLKVTAAGRSWVQTNDLVERDRSPVTLIGSSGLFAMDQRRAVSRILDRGEHYVAESRILHVLDLVERLGSSHTGPLPQRSDAAPAP